MDCFARARSYRSVEFMDCKDVFILIKTSHDVMIMYESFYCTIYSFGNFYVVNF
jgi:hypothetical protein